MIVKKYQADNGIFNSSEFTQALEDVHQVIQFSGVGAKFQNSVAERAIGTCQNMARAMLLHVRLHWLDEFDPNLWPFALDYAVWIYNHIPMPDRGGFSPEELFSRSKGGCELLRRLRVFGCPAYVLDPKLQDGKKIPKWEPRARCGMFLGFSPEHSTTIGLILNVRTGAISPQYHVVYDELFETVNSENVADLSEVWIDLWLNAREFYLDGWDEEVEGPFPSLDPSYQGTSDAQDDDEDDKQGEPSDADPVPLHPPVNQGEPSGWFDVEENSPQTPQPQQQQQQPQPQPQPQQQQQQPQQQQQDPSDDQPKKVSFNPEEEIVEDQSTTSQQEIQSPRRGSSRETSTILDSPLASPTPTAATDSPTDSPSSSVHSSPRRTRSGTPYSAPKKSAKSSMFRPISSRSFTHVQSITDPSNLIYATLDWETVSETHMYRKFHEMFSTLRNQI